jgi:hypothetical protein
MGGATKERGSLVLFSSFRYPVVKVRTDKQKKSTTAIFACQIAMGLFQVRLSY